MPAQNTSKSSLPRAFLVWTHHGVRRPRLFSILLSLCPQPKPLRTLQPTILDHFVFQRGHGLILQWTLWTGLLNAIHPLSSKIILPSHMVEADHVPFRDFCMFSLWVIIDHLTNQVQPVLNRACQQTQIASPSEFEDIKKRIFCWLNFATLCSN